jgi:hypothetical protein
MCDVPVDRDDGGAELACIDSRKRGNVAGNIADTHFDAHRIARTREQRRQLQTHLRLFIGVFLAPEKSRWLGQQYIAGL